MADAAVAQRLCTDITSIDYWNKRKIIIHNIKEEEM